MRTYQVLVVCFTLTILCSATTARTQFPADPMKSGGKFPHIKINQKPKNQEDVDVQTEWREDGSVKLDFASHGRKHHFELKKSGIDLSMVPIRLLGSSDEQQKLVEEKLKTLTLMTDRLTGAAVAFQQEDEQSEPSLLEGVFRMGKYEFAIQKDIYSKKIKVQRKYAKDYTEKYLRDKVKAIKKSRVKRSNSINYQPVTAEVELVWLLDYSIYADITQLTATDLSTLTDANHTVHIFTYFAHVTSIMNDYYRTMQNANLSISVTLAGMVLLTNPTTYPNLIEDHKTQGNEIAMDGTLERLEAWLGTTEGQNALPPYDHVVLATMYDILDDDGTSGLNGVAFLGAICSPTQSTSFLEVRDLMATTVNTAVHELGHNLGADHDGVLSSSSCLSDKYIMDSAGGDLDILEYRSMFSCCSQRAFYATINTDGACLKTTEKSKNYDLTIDTNVNAYLPGEVFTADDQCYIKENTEACGDWIYTDSNSSICRNLYCVSPTDASSCTSDGNPAVDGTVCAAGKWCLKGACVSTSASRPDVDLNCDVNSCTSPENTCTAGTNSNFPGMPACYSDAQQCNGASECSDGSDEANCGGTTQGTTTAPRSCPPGYRACTTGENQYTVPAGVAEFCVHYTSICDKTNDCTDKSDEASCDGDCYICTDSAFCVSTEDDCKTKCGNDTSCVENLPGGATSVVAVWSVLLCALTCVLTTIVF